MSVGYAEGVPGTRNLAVAITGRHDLPIHGYSLAIAYPHNALQLLEISAQGTATEEVGVDFFHKELDPDSGTAVLGVIFAFSDPYLPAELPATPPSSASQLLVWLIFDVLPGAPAGSHPVQLVDGLGDPPISNRFTFKGTTIRPGLQSGKVTIFSQYVITLDSTFAVPGFRLDPIYAYARHPRPLQGFQTAVSFDPRALNLESATWSGTDLVALMGGPAKIEFSVINWKMPDIQVSPTEARTTAGVLFDYLEPFNEGQVLPPETRSTKSQRIMKYSFQPKEGADQFGDSVSLALSDSTAIDAINNTFIADKVSHVPKKVDGRIYFSTGFLTGKVIDFKTGLPLSGAKLTTDPGEYTSTSGADGSFRLGDADGLPPGPYSIVATKQGYYPGHLDTEAPGKGATADAGTVGLFPVPASTNGFRRGSVNTDQALDISDGIHLLSYLFLGGVTIGCLDAADSTDDGDLDLTDAVYIFSYLFTGGAPLPSPFVLCGPDPTADGLGCLVPTGC